MTTTASTTFAPAAAPTPNGLLRRGARAFLATTDSAAGPVLRLSLAAVMFPHGAQKLLGWFGGDGYAATSGWLQSEVGLPALMAAGLILLEFFGPLLLVVGFATRAVALGLVGVMLGAIATVHAQFGFFMNWSGQQAGEGFEFHLLVIALALGLAIQGAGAASLDRWAARSLATRR